MEKIESKPVLFAFIASNINVAPLMKIFVESGLFFLFSDQRMIIVVIGF